MNEVQVYVAFVRTERDFAVEPVIDIDHFDFLPSEFHGKLQKEKILNHGAQVTAERFQAFPAERDSQIREKDSEFFDCFARKLFFSL